MNSFFITTLGCHKNQADSRQMHRSMRAIGYLPVSNANAADYHLINSCAFVESAREETIQVVLESSEIKKTENQKLILVGCFSERYKDDILQDLPEVDFLFGTGQYDLAGSLIHEKFGGPIQKNSVTKNDYTSFQDEIWAPVKIADGCNRSCAFCAIPQMRGKFRSIEQDKIVAEVQELVSCGIKEICLVSQDNNQYGSTANDLLSLIEKLHKIPGLVWIRLLYMYPDSRTLSIYKELARLQLPKFVPYLESPVQHVSKKVLKSMKRYAEPTGFEDFFAEIRSLFFDLEIRTSFLCGFPGEEREDIDSLLHFVENVKPEKLALFSYSHESGTHGFKLQDSITQTQKNERISMIRNSHIKVLKEYHKSRIGRTYECIVDRLESDQTMVARRPQDAPEIDELVFVEDLKGKSFEPGSLVDVEINGFFEYDMSGILV